MSKPNKAIESGDLKLFFDNHNGVLDQAEEYLDKLAEQIMRHESHKVVRRLPD
jgi:hypothetical protein